MPSGKRDAAAAAVEETAQLPQRRRLCTPASPRPQAEASAFKLRTNVPFCKKEGCGLKCNRRVSSSWDNRDRVYYKCPMYSDGDKEDRNDPHRWVWMDEYQAGVEQSGPCRRPSDSYCRDCKQRGHWPEDCPNKPRAALVGTFSVHIIATGSSPRADPATPVKSTPPRPQAIQADAWGSNPSNQQGVPKASSTGSAAAQATPRSAAVPPPSAAAPDLTAGTTPAAVFQLILAAMSPAQRQLFWSLVQVVKSANGGNITEAQLVNIVSLVAATQTGPQQAQLTGPTQAGGIAGAVLSGPTAGGQGVKVKAEHGTTGPTAKQEVKSEDVKVEVKEEEGAKGSVLQHSTSGNTNWGTGHTSPAATAATPQPPAAGAAPPAGGLVPGAPMSAVLKSEAPPAGIQVKAEQAMAMPLGPVVSSYPGDGIATWPSPQPPMDDEGAAIAAAAAAAAAAAMALM